MKILTVVLVTVLSNVASAQVRSKIIDIHKVDFQNFTYQTKCGQDTGDGRVPTKIQVRNGEWFTGKDSQDVGFLIRKDFIQYGGVLPNGREQAVVVSLCAQNGSTEPYSEIFVFDLRQGKPILVGTLPPPTDSKDGWGWGYPQTSVKNGGIIVVYDDGGSHAQHQRVVTTRYTWNGNSFIVAGTGSRPLP